VKLDPEGTEDAKDLEDALGQQERRVVTEDAEREDKVFAGKIRGKWKRVSIVVGNFSENVKLMKTALKIS